MSSTGLQSDQCNRAPAFNASLELAPNVSLILSGSMLLPIARHEVHRSFFLGFLLDLYKTLSRRLETTELHYLDTESLGIGWCLETCTTFPPDLQSIEQALPLTLSLCLYR